MGDEKSFEDLKDMLAAQDKTAARIDERQKTVIKEISEIKEIVTGNGLTKRVTTLEVNQENNEKWFSRIWKVGAVIGVGVVMLVIDLIVDRLAF